MTVRLEITQKELKEWLMYCKQLNNGYHMSSGDIDDLLHLNHKIMETCHDIHNSNMIGGLK